MKEKEQNRLTCKFYGFLLERKDKTIVEKYNHIKDVVIEKD